MEELLERMLDREGAKYSFTGMQTGLRAADSIWDMKSRLKISSFWITWHDIGRAITIISPFQAGAIRPLLNCLFHHFNWLSQPTIGPLRNAVNSMWKFPFSAADVSEILFNFLITQSDNYSMRYQFCFSQAETNRHLKTSKPFIKDLDIKDLDVWFAITAITSSDLSTYSLLWAAFICYQRVFFIPASHLASW